MDAHAVQRGDVRTDEPVEDDAYLKGLGEAVICEKLQRDTILSWLNPYSMKDLKAIMSIYCASTSLLSKTDLVEVVFKRQGRFTLRGDFVLENWETMSLKAMKRAVEDAQPQVFEGEVLWPKGAIPVSELTTKEAILNEYRCLTYIPEAVYRTYRGGVEVIKKMETLQGIMDLEENPSCAEGYFEFAAQAGMDLDVISKFLDVYYVQIANTDALHLAAGCGHIDIVKFLLEVHDADIEQRDLDMMTPLLTAAEAAHWDIVRYLLDRGADITATDHHGATLMHVATQSADIGFLRMLLDTYELDAHAVDNKGTTAVHYAAIGGDIEMVKFLVDDLKVPFLREWEVSPAGAVDNPLGEPRGGTLLMSVAGAGYQSMFRFCVDTYGLDPLAKDWRSCSLIFDCARSGQDEMIDFLVSEYGVDPKELDDEGCTPLFDAASMGHFHTIEKLVTEYDVDPHHLDEHGQNILTVAAMVGDETLFFQIAETFDVDMEVPDRDGMAPIDYLEEFLAAGGEMPGSDVSFDSDGSFDSDESDDSDSEYETDSGSDSGESEGRTRHVRERLRMRQAHRRAALLQSAVAGLVGNHGHATIAALMEAVGRGDEFALPPDAILSPEFHEELLGGLLERVNVDHRVFNNRRRERQLGESSDSGDGDP